MIVVLPFAFSCGAAAPALAPQDVAFEFFGDQSGSYFGEEVAGGGDVDGDGWLDFAVGALGSNTVAPSAGAVWVYSGRDGQVLHALYGEAAYSYFGSSLDLRGDVNLDGRADLLIGARGGVGRLYAYSGLDGALLWRVVIPDLEEFASGPLNSVAVVGDVNGNGHPDVVAGVSDQNTLGRIDSGVLHVLEGRDGSLIRTHRGDAAFDYMGYSAAPAGDVDLDGVPDYVTGGHEYDDVFIDMGSVWVFSGATGARLHQFVGDQTNDCLGYSVEGPGDLDGDGYGDILAGGVPGGENYSTSGLRSYVRAYSGRTREPLYARFGDHPQSFYGRQLAGLGDWNGDGCADFAVAASDERQVLTWFAGLVRVYSGIDGGVFLTLRAPVIAGHFGSDVAAAADMDRDGRGDLIVGIERYDGVLPDQGAARVFLLRPVPEIEAIDLIAGQTTTLRVRGCPAGARVSYYYSTVGFGSTTVGSVVLDLASLVDFVGTATADAGGVADLRRRVPATAAGLDVFLQAAVASGGSSQPSSAIKTKVE